MEEFLRQHFNPERSDPALQPHASPELACNSHRKLNSPAAPQMLRICIGWLSAVHFYELCGEPISRERHPGTQTPLPAPALPTPPAPLQLPRSLLFSQLACLAPFMLAALVCDCLGWMLPREMGCLALSLSCFNHPGA